MKRRTGIGGYIAAIAVGIEPAEAGHVCNQGLPRASPEGFTGLTLGKLASRPG